MKGIHQAFKMRSAVLASALVFLSGVTGPVSATLMRTPVAADFVVVDSVNNYQWADVNNFIDMDYGNVLAEIDAMNLAAFAGATDWRLADRAEMDRLFTELVTLGDARQFDPVNTSVGFDSVVGRYAESWVIAPDSGSTRSADWRISDTDPDSSTTFDRKILPGTRYHDTFSSSTVGAFVVSTAAAQVPEPSSLALLAIGGLGAWSLRRRLR